jgi:hypothetical protein
MGTYKEIEKKKEKGRWARFSSIWNLGKGNTLMFNFSIL